jgi:hypothetical protein
MKLVVLAGVLAGTGCGSEGSSSTTAGTAGSGGDTTTTTPGTGGSAGTAGGGGPGGGSTGGGGSGGSGGSGVVLDPTPGIYRQACDGSAGIFIDHEHFLDANDENQVLRLYTRGQDAGPVQTFEISSDIGLDPSDEADLEGAARVGDRVYWISSHGRDKNGNLETMRYRFFATDLAGSVPDVGVTVPGSYETLLEEMLKSSNWITPNLEVITLLADRSQLGAASVPDLAPKLNGTCIEGLAAVPTAMNADRLLIGLRNPQYQSKAIVVSLLNPGAVLTQQIKPSFGEAILLDLGGLGIRAMAYSPFHGAVLIIGGPIDEGGPFKLYKWTGDPADPPSLVQDLVVPTSSAPEGIVVFPDSRYIQVLIDQGNFQIDGQSCKDAPEADQRFTDLIFEVD